MAAIAPTAGLVYRTAHIRLRATRHQTDHCYRLLRAAGDVWPGCSMTTGNASSTDSHR
jgi:hypothetical protein